jgi:hypothetical protein
MTVNSRQASSQKSKKGPLPPLTQIIGGLCEEEEPWLGRVADGQTLMDVGGVVKRPDGIHKRACSCVPPSYPCRPGLANHNDPAICRKLSQ